MNTCLKAGVNSKQFWNKDALANTYKPNRARDIATTNLLTSRR